MYLLFSLILLLISATDIRCRTVSIISDIKKSIALANIAVTFIDKLKDEVDINYIKKPGVFDLTDISPEVARILNKPVLTTADISIFFDILWTPHVSHVSYVPDSKIKIAYSMFEANAIVPEWVNILNDKFDAVVVPDPWLVEIYKNSGVKKPVYVLPIMLDLEQYLQEPIHIRNKKFRFGMIGSYAGGGHKNHALLLEAFCKKFPNNKNTELIIHSRSRVEILHDLVKKYKVSNVRFIEEELTEKSYFDLIKSFDCYVLLSKGEGFSITPRQALALGIPCILSDCAAQSTICKTGFVRAVKANQQEPAYFPHLGKTSGYYMNCSCVDVENALLDVYKNYEHWIGLAKEGKNWVAQYAGKETIDKFRTLILPTRIELSSFDEVREGVLYTTSKHFYQKMLSLN